MENENFDLHVYPPGHGRPHSLPVDHYLQSPGSPLTAEDVLTEALVRKAACGDTQSATRWVPVFRVPGTDTWLGLTGQIHPDDTDMGMFERAVMAAREFECREENLPPDCGEPPC